MFNHCNNSLAFLCFQWLLMLCTCIIPCLPPQNLWFQDSLCLQGGYHEVWPCLPVPRIGISFPLFLGSRQCSLNLLLSLRSLLETSLCAGTSSCWVMTKAGAQMPSPQWFPFCCHLLYSWIGDGVNFNTVYSNLPDGSSYTEVCLGLAVSLQSFICMKLWEYEKYSIRSHMTGFNRAWRFAFAGLAFPLWTELFPPICRQASGGSSDVWIKLCHNNIDWSVLTVKEAKLSCSVNAVSLCYQNLTF